jgi:hypothetical protein
VGHYSTLVVTVSVVVVSVCSCVMDAVVARVLGVVAGAVVLFSR